MPQAGPPAAPTGLVATPGSTQVALDWADNGEPDLAGYNVYQATSPGGLYTKLNGSLLTSSNYTDTGLTNGTTYYYVVRAENDTAQESGDSAEVNETPVDAPPAAPIGLAATPQNAQVYLDWADNGEPDLAGYNIYRSTTAGGPYTKVNGTLVGPSAYTDTGLTGGVTYYYVVRAENTGAQESSNSNESSATPYSILIAAPTADAQVDQKKPGTNYGASTAVTVKSKNNQAMRGLVQFDVSSIAAGSTVNSASLTLCSTAVAGGRSYDVHMVTAAWAEGTVTWTNQPGVAASPTTSATTPGSPGCMSWTVTADVQAWVDGTANNGWRVSDSVETNNATTNFRSREDTSVPSEQPDLTVNFTPP